MAYQAVQRNLELMVPELSAYAQAGILDEDELKKIVTCRRNHEHQLSGAAGVPPLSAFLAYATHLCMTRELVSRRWVRMGHQQKELFIEARLPTKRLSSLLRKMLQRHADNPEAWVAAFKLLKKAHLNDQRVEIAAEYVRLFPTSVDPWVISAAIAEEEEGIDEARDKYRQGMARVSGMILDRSQPHCQQTLANLLMDTSASVRISSKGALALNWALLELRYLHILRGTHTDEGYMSDFVVDTLLSKKDPMYPILQGSLVELVLRDGIISTLTAHHKTFSEKIEARMLTAYERGELPFLKSLHDWRVVYYAGHVRESPAVAEFLRYAEKPIRAVTGTYRWLPWWTDRCLTNALRLAELAIEKMAERPELAHLKERIPSASPCLELDRFERAPIGDYSSDPLKHLTSFTLISERAAEGMTKDQETSDEEPL
ncbi:putative U3 small nucleolar RNA-associated protein 6 [Giardia muris]|uniref:Putative U3 small nucleolar RNA-associated protein 6 n=1 Tax=Giardia muris TaxID=5742 RepID=A0A4Z1SNM0_GIAMU|nr:putative U3 small nucleolar RNA-associated protein 6 [Giardia muris]|eukprot:TNJ27356.1 putative U3 small nucleolar RNA-associated protein 6 [Giardia muris]